MIREPEIFIPIIGYEDLYNISNYGNVFSIRNNIILQNCINSDGYYVIDLSKDGIHKQYRINRLVAIHFIPNPNDYPEVNHEDGDKLNNYYENLIWCTNYYNTNHSIYKLQNDSNKSRKLQDYEVLEIYNLINSKENLMTQEDIANMYNTSQSVISSIKLGRSYNDITLHNSITPVKFITMENVNSNKELLKANIFGENNPASKLTKEQVIDIYIRSNKGIETQQQIANEYNISQTLVYYIKTGKKWSELTNSIILD